MVKVDGPESTKVGKETEMTQIIIVESREKLPDNCRKVGQSVGSYYPSAALAVYLDKQPVVWTLTESLYDETGAYRAYLVSYYVADVEAD